MHKEWIIRCAEAGKHILCEKPFVVDPIEAEEVFAAVKKANVFCMEALMYRCHPFTATLQELIQNKTIGDVRFINASYMADIAAVANTTKGGCILNLGCYPISLIRLLLGHEPIEMCVLGDMDMVRNNDSHASVILKFPNKILATVSTADDVGFYSQFDIFGTEGHLKLMTNPWYPNQEINKILIFKNDELNPIEISVTAEKPLYTYQIDVVNDAILKSHVSVGFPGISWEDSMGNIVVLDAWRKQVMDDELRAEEEILLM